MITPNFLIDRDVLKANIKNAQALCNQHGKRLCPMTKTHKSLEIAKMQIEEGATSLLVGTIDEAIVFQELGVELVFAYPIVNKEVIEKVKQLKCKVVLSIDNIAHLEILQDAKVNAPILVILNSGLDRLGVDCESVVSLSKAVEARGFEFRGISTHAGQVYKASTKEEVLMVAKDEVRVLKEAYSLLIEAGFSNFEVCTGTTPTFFEIVSTDFITTFRPGNYVYFDAIQIALGVCEEKDCALSVLASVISNPDQDKYILDVGSKCLGLDKGAHGNSAINGYGVIVGHDALLQSLSEEVSILITKEPMAIGDKVRIIPNHSCSANNMTSKLFDTTSNTYIKIDARSNS